MRTSDQLTGHPTIYVPIIYIILYTYLIEHYSPDLISFINHDIIVKFPPPRRRRRDKKSFVVRAVPILYLRNVNHCVPVMCHYIIITTHTHARTHVNTHTHTQIFGFLTWNTYFVLTVIYYSKARGKLICLFVPTVLVTYLLLLSV